MVCVISRSKDHQSVEDGQNLGLAPRHVAIPQLEMAAEILVPVAVEIHEHVQPSVQPEARMLVEISVDGQLSAADDLMQSPAVEAGIGDDILDARNFGEKLEEGNRVEVIEEQP